MSRLSGRKPKIGIIGECMVELSRIKTGFQQGYGGDTLNTAIYIKRTSPDIRVSYITGLGVDSLSQEMQASWEKEGIDCQYIVKDPNRLPGLYLIETDAQGERKFLYWRNNSAAKYWMEQPDGEEILESISTFDFIYLSGISLAILPEEFRLKLIVCLKKAADSGLKIIFDNNYRPKLWESTATARHYYESILAITFMAFITADDDYLLWDENSLEQILDRTKQLGVQNIIIKQGAEPCVISTLDSSIVIAAERVPQEQVIDTTAAGDSFSAGFISAYLSGLQLDQAAKFAHLLASKVISHKGAIIPINSIPKIDG